MYGLELAENRATKGVQQILGIFNASLTWFES